MHFRHCWVVLGVFLVSATGGSASGWNHEEEQEDYSLLLLGRRSNSSEGTSWKPGSPSTWICYSTAGSESSSTSISVNH